MRLARSNENIEGSFDNDVMIGDAGPNMMLGQPGEDSFYGRGGEDIIDARDGVHDAYDQLQAEDERQSDTRPSPVSRALRNLLTRLAGADRIAAGPAAA